MGQVRKIKAGLVKIPVGDFIGEDGNVFFDIDEGVMRLSDGNTPGGIPLNTNIPTNLIPTVSETYDLGSSTKKWRDLYLSGSTIYLGDAQITSSGTTIDLPAGTTINGSSISSGGSFEGTIASTDAAGIVRIGNGLSVDESGVISVDIDGGNASSTYD